MQKGVDQSGPLLEFLVELTTHLIASGVTLQVFKDLAEVAFVRAASAKARLRNSRVSQSSLAAITGLSRGQIRAVLRKRKAEPHRPTDPIAQLMLGWTTDLRFSDSKMRPKVIPLKGASGSFYALAKHYGGDVTPKSLLREMLRRRKVQILDECVELLGSKRGKERSPELDGLTMNLAKALSAPAANQEGARIRAVCLQKTFSALGRKESSILKRRSSQALQAFFSDLESVVASVESPRKGRAKKTEKVSKLSVVFISQE